MLLSILLIVVGLTVFDKGPAGRELRRWLIDASARHLGRVSRRQVWGIAFVGLMGLAALTVFEAEGLRLFSMAAPELTAWAMMFDVTVVFDLMVLAISLRAASTWRAVARQTKAMTRPAVGVARRVGTAMTARARRPRRPRPPRPGCDDAAPAGMFAWPQPA
ncbi:hypothetical protein [Brevundimonas sp. UBA7534]|uniref:hypothetical protein n=1 Tax=Brevundimonas sp. UBA7534 TaxID=1946138 RepID=UPI0025C0A923|nr:hypothetical protein [Brevundimonas sp. UBA7534]